MNVLRLIPVVIIFLAFNFAFLKAAKCNSCEKRIFPEKMQECVCPDDQFCNNLTKKCVKCDQCYDKWKEIIAKDKKEVENVVDNLLEKYKFDIAEFKKLVNIFNKNRRDRQNELGLITKNDEIFVREIEKVSKNLDYLKEEVTKVELQLKKVETVTPINKILKFLDAERNSIKQMLQKLNKLKFDSFNLSENKSFIENLIQKLKNIDTNVPTVGKTSFNLALSTERDIELLEKIISTKQHLSDSTVKNTRWIEEDLLWLFNLLKGESISSNISALLKNSTHLRANATNLAKKLDQLLKKEREIETNYKRVRNELLEEKKFYEKLIKLNKSLQALKSEIKILEDLLNKFRSKKKLHDILRILFLQQQRVQNKTSEVKNLIPKLEKLYKEKEELTKQYIENFLPIEDIQNENEKMQKEIEKMTNDIINFCSIEQ